MLKDRQVDRGRERERQVDREVDRDISIGIDTGRGIDEFAFTLKLYKIEVLVWASSY